MRLLSALLLALAAPAAAQPSTIPARVQAVLAKTPLVDGHNDFAWQLRDVFGPGALTADLRDLRGRAPPFDTDVQRLKAGHVGGQFWSVWVPVDIAGDAAVRTTLEQIDLVRSLPRRYPDTFELARTAADVRRIHAAGRVASLIGVEGGHQINNSLAVLREYRALGVGYMTLTHTKNTDWADSATDDPRANGLTPFGRAVVHEMNRLGMLVDLSHVSPDTMRAALAVTRAPVIFSHSGARGVVDHPRNVPDDVLRLLKANGGVVMAVFAPGYVSDARRRWSADRSAERRRLNDPPYGGLLIGQPAAAKAAVARWEAAHLKPTVTLSQVADHIDHIARVAGRDHVGIGSDFDGLDGDTPEGLHGVDRLPALLAEMARRGWSDAELAGLAGGNVLRAMEGAEATAARLATEPPSAATVAMDQPAAR